MTGCAKQIPSANPCLYGTGQWSIIDNWRDGVKNDAAGNILASQITKNNLNYMQYCGLTTVN